MVITAPKHADIFQNGDLNVLEWQPPHTRAFDGFPYPIFVGNSRFIKMAAKDKVKVFLDFQGKFLFVYMRQRVKHEDCANIKQKYSAAVQPIRSQFNKAFLPAESIQQSNLAR